MPGDTYSIIDLGEAILCKSEKQIRQNSRILGFDLRIPIECLSVLWDSERIKTYLCCPEVFCVLSVDANVWPKALSTNTYMEELGMINGKGLWNEYEALFSAAADELGRREACFICVTIHNAYLERYMNLFYDENVAMHWKSEFNDVIPVSLDDSWQFLGFDVADPWLLSFLSNMGIGENSALSPDLLNNFNLVSEFKSVPYVIEYANSYAFEHAPFFPFGLFLKGHLET